MVICFIYDCSHKSGRDNFSAVFIAFLYKAPVEIFSLIAGSPGCMILPISQLHTQQVITSQIRSHRIFNTDLLYSCAYFIVEIGGKDLALMTVFNTIQ